MKISAVSFGAFCQPADETKHERLQNVADKYSTGSKTEKELIKMSHDVLDITPWYCSEGTSLMPEDRVKADSFMETLQKTIIEGKTKLATAIGVAIRYHSPAGTADNCDFDNELPLGKIKNLDYVLLSQKYVKPEELGAKIEDGTRVVEVYENGETVKKVLNPEFVNVSNHVHSEFYPQKKTWIG